jgi:uncharacterized protein with GYD domain
MATYFILATWTDEGVRGIKDTVQRAQNFRTICEQHGVKVLSLHWTQGRYDNIAVVEGPDEQSVMASVLASCQKGFTRTETLRAFTDTEMSAMLQEV